MSSPLPSSTAALVTGASSGIGEAFARQLAARGHAVTLVARRKDRLEELAGELRHSGAEVTVHAADLADRDQRGELAAMLRHSPAPWLLVNNAGYGTRGAFTELDQLGELKQIEINLVAVHELTRAAVEANLAAGAGGIINVASTHAYQPVPFMATYGACKAFVLLFTEALEEELRGRGVRLMALCPGPVRSEFGSIAGNTQQIERFRPMTPEACVTSALHAFDRGRVVCVPGRTNVALSALPRVLPRFVVRRVYGKAFAQGGPPLVG